MSESWEEKRKQLREQAEKLLASQSAEAAPEAQAALERVLHDLSVHQIELELQNEELLRAQQEMQAAHDSYARLYNQAPVGYLSLDSNGIILQTNQTFADMLGISARKIIGKTLAEFILLEDRPIFLGRFRSFFNKPQDKSLDVRLAQPLKHAKGHLCVHLAGRLETDGRLPSSSDPQTYLLVIVSDISAQKAIEDALRQAKTELETKNQELYQAYVREQLLARTDTLTGINNRRYFFEVAVHEFNAAVRYSHPLSAIMFDIDHFKELNDTYGHQAGDDMLRNLAQLTRQQLRSADILARYGGEEFVILLPYTRLKQAYLVAERIRETVAAFRLTWNEHKIGITLSLGVAEFDSQTDSLDKLIQRADQAMYEAKNGGRNRTQVFGER